MLLDVSNAIDSINEVHSPNQLQEIDTSALIVQGLQRKQDKDIKKQKKKEKRRRRTGQNQEEIISQAKQMMRLIMK